jgi:hypothetical protein
VAVRVVILPIAFKGDANRPVSAMLMMNQRASNLRGGISLALWVYATKREIFRKPEPRQA